MKIPTKGSSKSGLDGGVRWSKIALRQSFREKRELLFLKDFWARFSERREGREMKGKVVIRGFYIELKHYVLQPDLLHLREGSLVFYSGHPTLCSVNSNHLLTGGLFLVFDLFFVYFLVFFMYLHVFRA